MNKRFIVGGLMAMLCGVILCRVPAAWAAEETASAVADRPSALAEIDGRVVSIDLAKHTLTVKDTHDQVVTLQVTHATVISSPGSSKLVLKNLQVNEKIHAYYMTADKKARQIDVSPAMPVMRDLETH